MTEWSSTSTVPANAYIMKITVDDTYSSSAYVGKETDYPIFQKNFKTKATDLYITNYEPKDMIEIGVDTDYPCLETGFAYAVSHNLGVIIKPGTYDYVNDEGYTLSGIGPYLPKKVIGYGAKIICNLASENWKYSPLNVKPNTGGTHVEGLEVVCSNCRYCIHDEQYLTTGYYHNTFKNLKLTHNSYASATLIRPICIGGGLGNVADVEIDNCICYSHDSYRGAHEDINYHSNPNGQTGNCTITCSNCKFENGIGPGSTSISGQTFKNKMYVSNCISGYEIQNLTAQNFDVISYNNVVR